MGSKPQPNYEAHAGFDLADELQFLATRTIEPNIFFNPSFLAPAMPRIEDREVRLAVMRDGADGRLRMLLPFSVERPAIPLMPRVMRVWSNPFGPVGTPLVDGDDPISVLEDFLSIIARPHLQLPTVLVLPDLYLDGPVAGLMRAIAIGRNLPVAIEERCERPFLQSDLDGDSYLRDALRSHHFREFRRLKRRLEAEGTLKYEVFRGSDAVREAFENFLLLEAAGWKGKSRTAIASDRLRAAFAREAVNELAVRDHVRIHSYSLDGRSVASIVVFIESGMAYTWKTAFDEQLSKFSPGTLLMLDVTRTHLEDPNIQATDSCAIPDHPVMSRIWSQKRAMGTIMIGLTQGSDRALRQASTQLHVHRQSRNALRNMRDRLRRAIGR
jgi:CelD/BcsL family acetyltransferase involved in cellulose biosynthesis